jgi:hypothetical protein
MSRGVLQHSKIGLDEDKSKHAAGLAQDFLSGKLKPRPSSTPRAL